MKLRLQKMIARALLLGMFVNAFLPMGLLAEDKSCNSCKPCHEKPHKKEEWDYVIVGAGGSGCALAARLSDPVHGRYKNSVLVLEAGVNLSDNPLVVNVNNILLAVAAANDPLLSIINLTYLLEDNPYSEFGYMEGRMWGGSTGHSYLEVIRGTPAVYNEWAAISGDNRWLYSNLLNNVIIPLEHYTPDGTPVQSPFGPTQRGISGPLFVTQEPPLSSDPFYQAVAVATGAPFVPDYNNPNYGDVGVSANQDYVTPPFLGANSIRSFAANAFLTGEPSVGVPAIVDANGNGLHGRKLKIVSNAHANRVIFSKDKRARGVEYVMGNAKDKCLTIKAKKGVILCTGGVSDPAILQRSGIGDAALLNSLDIPVVFANSNVGANLQDQYGQQGIIGGVTTSVVPPAYGVAFFGFAPATTTRQYLLSIFDTLALFPTGIANALGITEGIDVFGANWAPSSVGSVEIISKDPFVQPRINFDFFSNPTDVNEMIAFYNLLPEIAAQYNLITGTNTATVLWPTPEQYAGLNGGLLGAALDSLIPYNHITSTCRMATSAAMGVVDGTLNVFGVQNLMVASSAVEPFGTGGAFTAYVVGYELARTIRGE